MSDKNENRFNLGDLTQRWNPERHIDGNISRYPSRRPLIEEALSVNLRDLQKIHGRKNLLKSADEGKAIPVQLGGNSFHVYLTWESHRLPGRTEKWSDVCEGNCRIWLICLSCHRKARALYVLPLSQDQKPVITCRKCLGLRYQSENCCKNFWWRRIARPLKKLIRRQEKLLTQKRTQHVRDELDFIEGQIFMLAQRAKPKRRNTGCSALKRRYRDVHLLLGRQWE
jgi:hypothetical protein